ncbi:uncharacterized protein G2W53_019431 [Senna tora]|uniref:Uncharacterized protein n=1 Tax=Senna tora TaxID=362788 RepID=A0A834TVL9_9FABA|nr:uncharacterized protein G2W53_019431 [Senna tora]
MADGASDPTTFNSEGWRWRSSNMAEVAQKLEQAMGKVVEHGASFSNQFRPHIMQQDRFGLKEGSSRRRILTVIAAAPPSCCSS